jgi:hypothetical protein
LHSNKQEKKVIQDDTMTPEEKGKTAFQLFLKNKIKLFSDSYLATGFLLVDW